MAILFVTSEPGPCSDHLADAQMRLHRSVSQRCMSASPDRNVWSLMVAFMTFISWALAVTSVLGLGWTIAAAVFFPTITMPIIEKIMAALLGCKWCLIVAAFVLSVLASYWYGHHGEYAKGYDAALSAIAAEDAAAIQRATEKRAVWQECHQRSGTWDQSTGECK